MTKILPKELTSYDLLKTFAVVFMIIDHIGYYFFPEQLWWRVLGRMCVPAWFFLIGYAQSRDIGLRLSLGALILACGHLAAGLYLLPFNILVAIILVRLMLNPVMEWALARKVRLWMIAVLLFLLALPSGALFEYGSLGFAAAMYGYLLRHRDELPAQWRNVPQNFAMFFLVMFVVFQAFFFGFSSLQTNVLFTGILAVLGVLYFFRPATFPGLTASLPRPLVGLLHFTGRRTLEIYVGHLLLFNALGLVLVPERFSLFGWQVISEYYSSVF